MKKKLLSLLLLTTLLVSCNNTSAGQKTEWVTGKDTPNEHLKVNDGTFYFDTDDYIIYQYNNESWELITELSSTEENTGKSAYEIYISTHPEYSKSELEWIEDLVNDRLVETAIYTVTFNPDNGTDNFTSKVVENKKVAKPEDPKKEGYEFLGWYNQYDELWVFGGYNITENITLTAKWGSLSSDANNGSSNNGGASSSDSGNTEIPQA